MNDRKEPIRPEDVSILKQSQASQSATTAHEGETIVVPLIEEYLDVNKQWVQTGEVVVRKSVQTTTQTIPVDVAYEEVQVDHVPVNRPLAYDEKTEPWWDGDVMVVPVIEEEIVVMKRQVLKEELLIYKRRLIRHESVSDTVRSEQVHVEATGNLQPVKGEESGGVTNR